MIKAIAIVCLLLAVGAVVEGAVIPLYRREVPLSHRAQFKAYLQDVAGERMYVSRRANIPIKGNYSDAMYFAQINIGTPPQPSYVQLDTGSSDYGVYTTGCSGCSPDKTFYNPGASRSLFNIDCSGNGEFQCPKCSNSQCGFYDLYGDGSHIGGRVALETFNLPAPGQTFTAANVSFGMIQSSSPNFEPQGVDGIWGLAFSSLSAWRGKTIFEQMVQQNGWQDMFGMCLQNNAAYFLPDEPAPSATSWTPLVGSNYYSVSVQDLKVAGTSVGLSPSVLNQGGAIVDSGTTLIVASSTIYSAVTGAISAMCQSGANLVGVCGATSGQTLFDGYCYDMSASDIALFPTIQVALQNTGDLDVSPQTYLQQTTINGSRVTCFAMANGGSGSLGFILGDTFMANFRVTFDRTNQRVGFSPVSTCP